jgi:hypothetical protein
MKVPTLISLAAAILLTSRGFSAPYDHFAAKGYRWVTTNGPYACPSKDALRQIIRHHTDETELQMIEQPRAYYLIEGAIVQVVLEDAAAGMSQIHSAEIGPSLNFSAGIPLGTPTERSSSHARVSPRTHEIPSSEMV